MGLWSPLPRSPPPHPALPGEKALALWRHGQDQELCDSMSVLVVGVDLPPVWCLCGCFSFAGSSQLYNEHHWLQEQRRGSQRAGEGVGTVVHALVSVSSRRLPEYKWDVLIHLNQGHMFRPTVECSELNEALCCICHSPQEIKLGTHSALQETLCHLQRVRCCVKMTL